MGLKDLFSRKRTPFEELWKQVEGISEGAKKSVSSDLSDKTKRKLEKYTPSAVSEIIGEAFAEINRGSVERMDSLVKRGIMNKKKKIRRIISIIAIGIIIVVFLIVNYNIHVAQKKHLSLVSDGSKYCYGIDSLEEEGDLLTLKGWFVELKSVRNVLQNVSDDDSELMIALLPVEEANRVEATENAVFLSVKTMHENRPDVNEYLKCEYDYSKCGFSATVDLKELSLGLTNYRLVIKPDAMKTEGILSNVYLTDKGIEYTDPAQSPELETAGTDLDCIVKTGIRLVSRPDYSCYVYQLEDKLYWIADRDFAFSDAGFTYIQYQMDTTQISNLPSDRLEHNWFWSNIGGYFEQYEISDQINCGKYRVMMRDIPRDYSVTSIVTGYHDGKNWSWRELFKPIVQITE